MPTDDGYSTEFEAADNFLRGVQLGVERFGDIAHYETVAGPSDGFVYFIGIGDPYITHVKVGYTKSNPYARMASLQTGCPFKMTMIGFVFGILGREQDLHCVFEDYRGIGEWFEYSPWVANVINDQLTGAML